MTAQNVTKAATLRSSSLRSTSCPELVPKVRSRRDAEPQNLTRREFLTTSCMALPAAAGLSGAATGLGAQRLLAEESPKPTGVPNINPGYIGPQFFDEREEEALLEVLESRSPFRFWGKGKPSKVLRFEENFAKYMGTRFGPGSQGS